MKQFSEEYLSLEELCSRIKYKKQTIYNLIHRKVFVQGTHYLKPSAKKLLFKWSEIRAWLGDTDLLGVEATPLATQVAGRTGPRSSINI